MNIQIFSTEEKQYCLSMPLAFALPQSKLINHI